MLVSWKIAPCENKDRTVWSIVFTVASARPNVTVVTSFFAKAFDVVERAEPLSCLT